MQWILTALGVLSVPLLVACNAFFVAAEFALVSVRRTRVEELVNARKVGAVAVRHAINHLDDAIAATQLGITLASLGLGWVGERTVASILEPVTRSLPGNWSDYTRHMIAGSIAFSLIT